MSHSDIIIIVATLTFSSTVGVYAAIRYINLHTRPPVNSLLRSREIELVDYIEPTHPQEIYNYPDLLTPQFPTHHRVHSYWSSTPPSYHTTDGLNINSCLENAINLDFILWLILFFIFIFIVKYLTFRFWKHVTPYAKQIFYL